MFLKFPTWRLRLNWTRRQQTRQISARGLWLFSPGVVVLSYDGDDTKDAVGQEASGLIACRPQPPYPTPSCPSQVPPHCSLAPPPPPPLLLCLLALPSALIFISLLQFGLKLLPYGIFLTHRHLSDFCLFTLFVFLYIEAMNWHRLQFFKHFAWHSYSVCLYLCKKNTKEIIIMAYLIGSRTKTVMAGVLWCFVSVPLIPSFQLPHCLSLRRGKLQFSYYLFLCLVFSLTDSQQKFSCLVTFFL